jgi:DnaJ-class molecular chaperone
MGIIDRLGNVIRSYLNDDEQGGGSGKTFRRENRRAEDPDLQAAYAELDEFLKGKTRRDEGGAGVGTAGEDKSAGGKTAARNTPPESLRPDFAELGLPFGAGKAECWTAYRRLLKLHHPDRHASHQGNMDKATNKTARLNAAYDRIKTWQEGRT